MHTKRSLEYWNSIARRHCFVNVLDVEYNTHGRTKDSFPKKTAPIGLGRIVKLNVHLGHVLTE